jgi:hypothetical protein
MKDEEQLVTLDLTIGEKESLLIQAAYALGVSHARTGSVMDDLVLIPAEVVRVLLARFGQR